MDSHWEVSKLHYLGRIEDGQISVHGNPWAGIMIDADDYEYFQNLRRKLH